METTEVVVPATAETIPPVAPEAGGTAAPVEAPVSGEQTPEAKPEKTFTQAELDAIVAKEKAKVERKAQRDRERAIAEVARAAQPQPQAKPDPGKPTPEQFKTTEEYVEAVAEWKADQKITERLAANQKVEREARQRQAQEESAATYRETEEAVRAKYDDFDEVAYNPRLPISDAMAQTIQLSEQGAELIYHLGKNPQEAARIFNLPPFLQAKELGKLEAKLASAPPAKPLSSAPEPINPVGGKGSHPVVDTTDPRSDKLSTAEWMKAEEARLKKKYQAQGYR